MKRFFSLLVIIIVALPCISFGAEKRRNTAEMGVLYFRQANNFSTRSPARIYDHHSGAETESTTMPIALINLSTTYGSNNILYLKMDIEQMEDRNMFLGTQIPLTDNGNRLDVSVFYSPFAEAWKNPYETGSDRDETDVDKYGMKVALHEILDTGLNMSIKVVTKDVDDDQIGRLYNSLGRDGNLYVLSASYRFTPVSTFHVYPSVTVERGDFDGGSNSYKGFGASLKMMYTYKSIRITPMIGYAFRNYDESHPLFNTTREDKNYIGAVIATYSDPFGLENFFIRAFGGYGKTDSNITFCDGEVKFTGLTVGYKF
jgi:hypothetical protein